MAQKPDKFPDWATEEEIDEVSGQANFVEPPDFRKESGWTRREIPPRQWFNWLARKTGLWFRWAEDRLESLGTASLADTGTEPESVPTNSDADARGFAQSVDSVSTLRTSTFPASLERLWLSGYYGVGTAGGGPLYRDSGDTTTVDNGGTVFVDGDGVRWKAGPGFVVAESFSVRVPEDYSTLNEGMNSLLNFHYVGDTRAEIKISEGHTISDFVIVFDSDCRAIEITSEDDFVSVDVDSSGFSLPFAVARSPRPAAFAFVNSRSPVISASFDLSGVTGTVDGVFALASYVFVSPGFGFRNATGDGCYLVDASTLSGHQSFFTDNGGNGVSVLNESVATLDGGDVSDNDGFGLQVTNRSTANIEDGFANNCERGISANDSSLVNARSCECNGCNEGVRSSVGSTVNARSIKANNCTTFGINALYGTITADDFAECNSAGDTGVRAVGTTALIYAQNISATGCANFAVSAERGSSVNVDDGDLRNSNNYAVRCSSSFLTMRDSDASGSANAPDIRWTSGSHIILTGSTGTLVADTLTISSRGIAYD